MTDLSQLSHGTSGSKESVVQRRLRLHVELLAVEEAELLEGVAFEESEDGVVPETVPTPTMAAMDLAVARDRVDVMINKTNPVATSQSAGVALSYHNPDANVDTDAEGDGDINVDVAEGDGGGGGGGGDANGHGDGNPFCDVAAGDDDESSDDDVGPLRPFHPGTFLDMMPRLELFALMAIFATVLSARSFLKAPPPGAAPQFSCGLRGTNKEAFCLRE
jgi:hypothetical protein